MFVELHLIQNFGPSCINRDDTNTPKDCQFGGYRRARISSQCLKSAIREYFKTQISVFKDTLGIRTKMLPKNVVDILVKIGKDEETATAVVKNVLSTIGFKTDAKDDKKTDVLLFLNHTTPQNLANVIKSNWDSFAGKKISKEALKLLDPILTEIKNDLDPDIALFGRMVASKTDLKVNSATYVAHALSTHKVDMEIDFFTAIDDLQEQTDAGAAMMGTIMYNSSCFYRYSVLDFDQLLQNLKGDAKFSTSVLKAYLEGSIKAIPTGKQTSMAGFSKPDFIMVILRADQPWSLANAFAKPAKVDLKDSDIIDQSISKLGDYLKEMFELYGKSEDLNLFFSLTGKRPIENLESLGTKCSSLEAMIKAIGEKINERNNSSS